jgi:hypothetical protein
MEAQVKSSVKQTEMQLEMQKMQMEVNFKKELMQMEFDFNMQLKGIETEGLMQREEKKEMAKDDRVKKQATAQSKLIDQRKNNLPPVNFESEDDSLDGFDLSGFEPR